MLPLHNHSDASPLPAAHVLEQGVDEEHDTPHLKSLLDGIPKVVGERIQEVLVVVPIGRHLHADGPSKEHAAGDHEAPPGPGWQVPQESEVRQAEQGSRDPAGNRPGVVEHVIEGFVETRDFVQRQSREGQREPVPVPDPRVSISPLALANEKQQGGRQQQRTRRVSGGDTVLPSSTSKSCRSDQGTLCHS